MSERMVATDTADKTWIVAKNMIIDILWVERWNYPHSHAYISLSKVYPAECQCVNVGYETLGGSNKSYACFTVKGRPRD